ncbi:MAG: RHS repeat-associated protein [Verrucomicrobiales bacterium]|jgi:RHS repeat-associated protein
MKFLAILISMIVLTGAIYGQAPPVADPGVDPMVVDMPGKQEEYHSTSGHKESWDPNAIDPGKGAFVWEWLDGFRYRRGPQSPPNRRPEDIPSATWIKVESPDTRNFKFETLGDPLTFRLPNANETRDEFLIRLDEPASADAVKNLNPKGKEIREILHQVLYQSWEYMTHLLNTGADDGNRKNLLRKIWEYRQWHHDFILAKTKADLGAQDPPIAAFNSSGNPYDFNIFRLNTWATSGSTTLTSDIDINLKGSDTEAAVHSFNELFLADGWEYEAGIVYDVNVYAMDFMYREVIFGVDSVNNEGIAPATKIVDLHGNIIKEKNAAGVTLVNQTAFATGMTGNEGARHGLITGGFTNDSPKIATDVSNQSDWPYVKARIYMNSGDFDAFCAEIGMPADTKDIIDLQYEVYFDEFLLQMAEKSGGSYTDTPNPNETGIQQLNSIARALSEPQGGRSDEKFEADANNLLMASSNRVYEDKLAEISSKRRTMGTVISVYNQEHIAGSEFAGFHNSDVEDKLVELRNLVSEGLLFANEAYVTHGAVNHAVVGIQIGAPVRLSNDESVNAVVENLADALKEIARHGGTAQNPDLGDASFKSGKYLFRLADAAINMGYLHHDIVNLYHAGDDISNYIKKETLDPGAQLSQSAARVRINFPGVDSPDALATKVREIAIAALQWNQAPLRGVGFGSTLSSAVGGAGNGTQEQYNSTSAHKESWDPKAIDRGDGKYGGAFVWTITSNNQTTRYRRANDSDANKRPDDIPSADWIAVTGPDTRNFKFENATAPLLLSSGESPAAFLARVDAALPAAIENLNPKGKALRGMMGNPLYQSWDYMTHQLNADPLNVNRKNLLRKIWEYRQWHHDFLLRETQATLGPNLVAGHYDTGEGRLTKWDAAGSTTLTSDIDVNLKGTDTEAAAKKFNELFKRNGWKYEPGVVYDVNVYSLDFLHAEGTFGSGMVTVHENTPENGFKTTKDLHGNVLKVKNTATDVTTTNNTAGGTGNAGKEGARSGRIQGGLSDTSLANTDTSDQAHWPHAKVRLYMIPAEFDTYWTAIGISSPTKFDVLARYNSYRQAVIAEMLKLSPLMAYTETPDPGLTGIQQLNAYAKSVLTRGNKSQAEFDADAANLLMAASNRVYESKIAAIHTNRNVMKGAISAYDAAPAPELIPPIEQKLQPIRMLVSESLLFANEAYITDGAVNHGVVGVQSGVPITLTNAETLNAVVENLADAIKEIARHGDTLGEAAFKSGKYIYRLADAAINMGYSTPDIYMLYQAGYEISDEIKRSLEQDPAAQLVQSEARVRSYLGVDSVEALKDKIYDIAVAVLVAKQESPASALTSAAGTAKPIVANFLFQNQAPLSASTVGNPYAFQGRRLDDETGNYYYRNRYYDPNTGQFLTIDPLGNWNHGQGNGASAFAEDGWNNSDPMGLGNERLDPEGYMAHRVGVVEEISPDKTVARITDKDNYGGFQRANFRRRLSGTYEAISFESVATPAISGKGGQQQTKERSKMELPSKKIALGHTAGGFESGASGDTRMMIAQKEGDNSGQHVQFENYWRAETLDRGLGLKIQSVFVDNGTTHGFWRFSAWSVHPTTGALTALQGRDAAVIGKFVLSSDLSEVRYHSEQLTPAGIKMKNKPYVRVPAAYRQSAEEGAEDVIMTP